MREEYRSNMKHFIKAKQNERAAKAIIIKEETPNALRQPPVDFMEWMLNNPNLDISDEVSSLMLQYSQNYRNQKQHKPE